MTTIIALPSAASIPVCGGVSVSAGATRSRIGTLTDAMVSRGKKFLCKGAGTNFIAPARGSLSRDAREPTVRVIRTDGARHVGSEETQKLLKLFRFR